jgi:hypothetical protein
MIAIRPARSSDAASLAAIAERTFRETFAADNSEENINLHCAQKFSAEIQGGEISDPQLSTLLAEVAGELVGFAQLRLAHGRSVTASGSGSGSTIPGPLPSTASAGSPWSVTMPSCWGKTGNAT